MSSVHSLKGQASNTELPLKNPGFEEGLTSWQVPAADHGMTQPLPEAAHSGKLGLKVLDGDPKNGSDASSVILPAKPGETYQVSFWAKTIQGEGLAVYIIFLDSKNKRLSIPGTAKGDLLRNIAPQGGNWQYYQLAGTAPEQTTALKIWIHSFSSSTVTAYLDDFKLDSAPSSAATSYGSSQGKPSTTPSASVPQWVGDADKLNDFPKPDPVKTYADLKLLQKDGSPYRTPQEDWAGARKLIAENPEWAEWFKTQKKTVDAWIAKNKDRAEWEAGWNHEFISPTDGAWLVWNDDIPDKFITSVSGEKVSVTPTIFRSWVGAFRKNHASKIAETGRLFRLTEDPRYAEWVASQLDFYANNYKAWEHGVAKRKNSWLGYQSLDDAVIVSRLIEGARLIFDWAPAARRQSWFEKLFKPEALLLEGTNQYIHNISMWHRSAEAQIALLYKDENLWKQAVEGKYGIKNQFRYGVTSDYFWYEQSLGYNDFVMSATEPLFTFTALLGEGNRLKEEAAIAQNLILSTCYIRFPNGTTPNPADSGSIPKAPSVWLENAYRILPTTYGIFKASDKKSWDTLVDPPSKVAGDRFSSCTDSLPPVTSRNMESTRFALMKKGKWQVFLQYGQVTKSHSQAEALNWSASYEGIDITHDPGTVGYGSPLCNGYYRRGLCQNVPLVGGEGQHPWNPGKLLKFDENSGTMSAEQPSYFPKGTTSTFGVPAPEVFLDGNTSASASRTIRIDGERLIDETRVWLADAKHDAPLGLALHLQGSPRLPEQFRPVSDEDFKKNRPNSFQYWKNVRRATFKDKAEIEVTYKEGLTLKVLFSTPGEFTIYQGESPDIPPRKREGFYIEKMGKDASFTTTITALAGSNP